ncbi:head GIN domain-containing protein [Flavobacterium sp. '19STA2R22 D10 B1']|uniref:head GIN domain-containing protein n=1 Tax=Flavobacterium aerium TaxID=3037261 RepID=UPI00278BD692|nr:head GIN domain-containing protein [Flavobacterium sp. '19STA2R22 D10 B1']
MVKTILLIAKFTIGVILSLLFVSCNIGSFGTKGVNGDGTVVTQNRTASAPFYSIQASNGLDIIIEQSDKQAIIVEADQNLQDHIKTSIENGVLEVTSDVNIKKASSKKVFIKIKELKELQTSSGADVRGKNTIVSKNIDLKSTSGSSIYITLKATNTKTVVSSGSSMEINGATQNYFVDSSSGSSLDAKDFKAQSITSEASSGGSMRINPVENLIATASSGGSIQYVNNPKTIKRKMSSGGSISLE